MAGKANIYERAAAEFDLSRTGFDPKEIDDLLLASDDDAANTVPPVPDNPVSRPGDVWLCGDRWVNIASYVLMPPALKPWHGSWESGSQR